MTADPHEPTAQRRPRFAAYRAAVCLLLAWSAAVSAQAPRDVLPQAPEATAPEPPARPAGTETDYRIGPRDRVAIRVFEVPDLDAEVSVAGNGNIEFTPIGEVPAEGKTPQELARELERRLEERFLQRATVSVELLEFRARPISVIGAVERPGNLNISGSLSLIEALTAAGGLVENHGPTIHVLRTAANGLSDQLEIPVDALLVEANRRYNIPVFANDVINVPTRVERVVYFIGEVARPGALQFGSNERFSLLAAVARAGGLTERAGRKVTIKRADRNGTEQELDFDYRDVVAGKLADPLLRNGDVLVIKESFF
jgi:polysaccharide biosynthesis/export protein